MIEFVLSEWRCYHPVICSKLFIIELLHSTFQLHSTHLFVCTAEAPEHQSEQWPPEKWKNENVAIRSHTYTSCHIGQLASIFMSEPAVRRACSLAQAVPMRLGSYRLGHAEVNTGIHCHESILSITISQYLITQHGDYFRSKRDGNSSTPVKNWRENNFFYQYK